MHGAGHIEKRDGAWGPCPASLGRPGQGRYSGLQTTLYTYRLNCCSEAPPGIPIVVRKHRPAFRSRRRSRLPPFATPKPHASRLGRLVVRHDYGQRRRRRCGETRSSEPSVMRSFSLDSGAVWEILQAFGIEMAALTILPQYGWVLITLILSVFV